MSYVIKCSAGYFMHDNRYNPPIAYVIKPKHDENPATQFTTYMEAALVARDLKGKVEELK